MREWGAFTVKPFGPVMLWEIDIKKKFKNATSNSHISKTRTNLESKPRFFKKFN